MGAVWLQPWNGPCGCDSASVITAIADDYADRGIDTAAGENNLLKNGKSFS
jgi:hypothetical protein